LARQQQQSGQQREGGRPGSRSGDSPARQALNQVEEALENMQGAASGERSARSAEQASRSLRQALEQIEQGRREGMAGEFESLAQRAQQLIEEQQRRKSELHSALRRCGTNPGARRFGPLDWEQAEAFAQRKRELQSQVQALERDMRSSAQKHREAAPRASDRVGQAANELGESNVAAGLARSAIELERGRGLSAAARDALITEVLEALKNDLSQAAQVAAAEGGERGKGTEQASPEELLAELAELRRAWQE